MNVESVGKTVEEALEAALKELNLKKEEVDYTVQLFRSEKKQRNRQELCYVKLEKKPTSWMKNRKLSITGLKKNGMIRLTL